MDLKQIKKDIIEDMEANSLDNEFDKVIYSLCDSIRNVYDDSERNSEEEEYLKGLKNKIGKYTKRQKREARFYLEPGKLYGELQNDDSHDLPFWFCWPLGDLESRIQWLDDNM